MFDEAGIYAFWMKDMMFPIDIIWLDEGFRVVAIAENAAPSSFPNLFTPSSPAQYVLEVPSGFVRTTTTRIGEYVHTKEWLGTAKCRVIQSVQGLALHNCTFVKHHL